MNIFLITLIYQFTVRYLGLTGTPLSNLGLNGIDVVLMFIIFFTIDHAVVKRFVINHIQRSSLPNQLRIDYSYCRSLLCGQYFINSRWQKSWSKNFLLYDNVQIYLYDTTLSYIYIINVVDGYFAEASLEDQGQEDHSKRHNRPREASAAVNVVLVLQVWVTLAVRARVRETSVHFIGAKVIHSVHVVGKSESKNVATNGLGASKVLIVVDPAEGVVVVAVALRYKVESVQIRNPHPTKKF